VYWIDPAAQHRQEVLERAFPQSHCGDQRLDGGQQEDSGSRRIAKLAANLLSR
jgi:hypothetical protein